MALLLSSMQTCQAADSIPTGAGSFQFVDELGNRDKPITVWTYAPAKLRADSPVVFVMHGAGRNGEAYRDHWIEHAEQKNFLLVVPEFSKAAYDDNAYQLGNLFGPKGRRNEPSKWTYSAIEHLFDHVKQLSGNTSPRYFIYGHSGGGQFVHRLVLFMPEARYERAIAANPGYYTMPDTKVAFPYGLKSSPAGDATLKKVLGRAFTLLLGDKDLIRDDPNFRKTPEADAQGKTRFERGKNFYATAKQQAEKLGTEFAWKQQTVRGAGHSDQQMSKAAVPALFGR